MPCIRDHVTAPAPRFLLRLDLLDDLLARCAPPARFAEIGPGRGDLALHLADRWPAATGLALDFSAATVAMLDQRFAGRDSLTARRADFTAELPGGPYDLVVACEVFEHIEDDAGAFAAVAGALAPGGHLLLSVPAFMRKWQQVDRAAGHVRRYERGELAARLAGAGLRAEAFWCYGFPLTNLMFPLRQAYYLLRSRGRDARAATEASGVERGFVARLPVAPVWAALRPFAWMQRRALHRDWGDGFLVLARRA